MNVWTEHRNPEGRTYWFNTGTRESVWEKPDDLKTPFERALNQTKWKEYFSGGRKYYYNTDSKESKWDMPDELLLLLEKVEKEAKAQQSAALAPNRLTAPAFTSGGNLPAAIQGAPGSLGGTDTSSSAPGSQPQTNGHTAAELAVGHHTGGLPFQSSSILPARPNLPDDPVIPHNGFQTVEEGEKAFVHLLRKAGVDARWTWDQTMRAIITDPLYKALNTLAEKKAVYQKYTEDLLAKEVEEREARLAKSRPAIRNMLRGNPSVFHYTTFATADKLFSQHPIWQMAKIEAERKLIFEEYVAELKQREVQESRASRARSVSKIVALFKRLDVDVTTRWRQAYNLVLDSDEWRDDEELQKLPTLDILLAFEDYSRVREREFEEQMRKMQVEKTRRERKAREAFKALLQSLVDSGKLKARTKWKEVYPLLANDIRYLDMLGKPGSNPIELFWDTVDALDQELDAKLAVAEDAIRRHNKKLEAQASGAEKTEGTDAKKGERAVPLFKVVSETTEEEFMAVIKAEADDAVRALKTGELLQIFRTLHEQAVKQEADERRRAERRQRHLQDDLRYALKKFPEPIDISLPYEEVVPLIQELPEFKALDDDEGRRASFAKFVKRQKERLREREREVSEDGGSATSRKRREAREDREREREHDRDRDRDREREREREYRERDVEHIDRDSRSSRHARPQEEYEAHGHRSSRDYPREREYSKEKAYYGREKEREKESVKERDYAYRSKSHRDHDRDDRRRDRRGSRGALDGLGGREWDEGSAYGHEAPPFREERERSASVFREEPREKRDRAAYEEKPFEERAEKRARYSIPPEAPQEEIKVKQEPPPRAETPEEGEI
ncbi:Pre-mRNA-processing protein [Sparassis crispa]|uniref:Pre-mRNA-processing protein n=1 Tax=Sparassis crispa TaxID=139825 RepID=A0A401GVX0_9APHY|nr:Pre-mRNA-processing protein [Sparassis crispa]GBE86371.1 Pre-mRNA-processing protein [Sparassis crispa]